MLSGTSFNVTTGYDLTETTIYTYPCSGSYLRFHASNINLQDDVAAEINRVGKEMGSTADCSALCDIENGSYDTVEKTGSGTIADFPNSDIICDADSAWLDNEDFVPGADGESQCRCDPDGDGYVAGCSTCTGTVSFSVGLCLNTEAFIDTTAAPIETADEEATRSPVEEPTRAPVKADDD
jgi:hypothetical protein